MTAVDTRSPALVRGPVWDTELVRRSASSAEGLPAAYRDQAMRAVEASDYPGADRERAQAAVERLLRDSDDRRGTLAQRILRSGSPAYQDAFGTLLAMGEHAMTPEQRRALALGVDSAGGYAVPFQLDPTVLMTSNGTVNPIRQIARVEQVTGKQFDAVTSAGVTATRAAEGTEPGTGDPAFTQPTVQTQRVQTFIPYSVELDLAWAGIRSQLLGLLTDAKDVEEGSSFIAGTGDPAPNGLVGTLGTAQVVKTAGTASIVLGDLTLLDNAVPNRFRPTSVIIGSKQTFNAFRAKFQASASQGPDDSWTGPRNGQPARFNAHDAYEASGLDATTTTGSNLLVQGDFQQFLIVDRVGMAVEIVPTVLGTVRGYPTGQRGVFAAWANNSEILVQNAFRLLQVT